MNRPIHRFALISATLCLSALTGCTLSSNPASSTPNDVSLGVIKGQAYGGNQPITSATVTIYAAGTGGYGTASVSLGSTTSDASTGFFTLPATYCTAGQQVYIYVSGGNTGGGTNTNSGLLAALGQCPATGGTLAGTVPYVWVNEVSTVAAAYAFAGFATDATHVSDDEGVGANTTAAVAKVGMANAFANAGLLENIGTGVANTTTGNATASGVSGTPTIIVPQAQINTIADILAACVNGTTGNSSCTTLFSNATSNGVANSGTIPTDTATAAINIAHHPAANVANLFTLVTATSPFLPDDSAQPFDYTVSILYPQGGTGTVGIAVDGLGNTYATYGGGNTLYKITPSATETFFTVSGPRRLAIDANNNVWVPSNSTTASTITKFDTSGNATAYTAYDNTGTKAAVSLLALAFDQNDALWALSGGTIKEANLISTFTSGTPNTATASVTVTVPAAPASLAFSAFTGDFGVTSGATTAGAFSLYTDAGGTVSATASGGGLYTPAALISDATGNFFIANTASTSTPVVSYFSGSAGTAVAASGYTITPPTQTVGTTTITTATSSLQSNEIDGLGNYFTGGTTTQSTNGATAVATGGIYELNAAGTQVAAFIPPTSNNQFFAVDPSGNLWFGGNKTIGEMIGVAAPKVTPQVIANFPGLLTGTGTPGAGNKVATRP